MTVYDCMLVLSLWTFVTPGLISTLNHRGCYNNKGISIDMICTYTYNLDMISLKRGSEIFLALSNISVRDLPPSCGTFRVQENFQ